MLTAKKISYFMCLGSVLGLLAGCESDQMITTGSFYPTNYKDRHPIVLTNGKTDLDIFINASQSSISRRQKSDLVAYFSTYRQQGQSKITMYTPVDSSSATLRSIEKAKSEILVFAQSMGIAKNRFEFTNYRIANPLLASPIRLSYRRLVARLGSKCGNWPQDLGATDIASYARNEDPWNYGCSTQANMVAQVADPLDLVRPRTEEAKNSSRAVTAIGKYNEGQDPSAKWQQDGTTQITNQIQSQS